MKQAVKTKKVALLAITRKLNLSIIDENKFKMVGGHCECGETPALMYNDGKCVACVNICPQCGDDDAFIDDIVEVIKL